MNKHYSRALDDWNGYLENTYEHLRLAALMSILDELKKLNNVMQCRNVAKGFRALVDIAKQNDTSFKRRVENATRKRLKRRGKS
jgi:hypothetical protein